MSKNGLVLSDVPTAQLLNLSTNNINPRFAQLRLSLFLYHFQQINSYLSASKLRDLMIVVKDKENQMVARCLLRIMWDATRQEPVLFMEKTYTNQKDYPYLSHLILQGCKEKARRMNLNLVSYTQLESPPYPGVLQALQSSIPYEYVDKLGIVQQEFTIDKDTYLVYEKNQ